MKKWEYEIVDADACRDVGQYGALNELGKKGWRLVPGMYTAPRGAIVGEKPEEVPYTFFIMEREIPEAPAEDEVEQARRQV